MQLKEVVSQDQLRWSDIAFGRVDGRWPAVSMARGTSAWSQLQKIDIDKGEVVISICVGDMAEPDYRGRITGFYVPDQFTAPTQTLVEPAFFEEASREYGAGRWPDSIACRAVYRFVAPPNVGDVVAVPRLVTWTRGRYLADLHAVAPETWERLAELEVEPLEPYRSPEYERLATQPRAATYRQAGRSPNVLGDIQGVLYNKVSSIFSAAQQSGKVYEYERPGRIVALSETALLFLLLELWETQSGRCAYCGILLETAGLAQVSVDRIDNANREYGRHNVHLTCWECNRGKGTASHDEMLSLYEKRWQAWEERRQQYAG